LKPWWITDKGDNIMTTTYFLYKGVFPDMSDKHIITLKIKMEKITKYGPTQKGMITKLHIKANWDCSTVKGCSILNYSTN